MSDADGQVLASSVFGWTNRREDGWWKVSRLAFNSPLALACRFECEPMWANAEGIRTSSPNPQIRRIDLTDFRQRSLTNSAIVVPVHMPFGIIGAASFVPVDQARTDLAAEFENHADMLATATRAFVTSYSKVMGTSLTMPLGNDLSGKEIECLRWAAVGKTDLEIGMIMSRSRATIRFHMHNAVAKLQSVNRSQAVFKATQLGYIGKHI
jgi:DNA-binding CsgD family transcriptional regulator